MKRWPLFVLGSLAVAALVAVAFLLRENAALREELAAAREAFVVRTAAVETPATPAPVVTADARDEVTVSTGAAAPEPAPPTSTERRGSDRRDRGTEFFARALSDPDARAAMLSRMKGEIDRRFGDYFVKLGLNDTQIEALRTLLAERQMSRMESGMLERLAETDEERAEAEAWRDATLASTESNINAILGDDGVKKLQAYLDSAPQRQVIEDIARRASYLGAPLSAAANDRLLATVSRAETDHPLPNLPGPGRGGWGGFGGRGEDRQPVTTETVSTYMSDLRAQNQQIIEQAREFLTQPQLEALADQQIDRLQQAEAQLNFMLRNPDTRGPGGFGGGRDGGGRRAGGGG